MDSKTVHNYSNYSSEELFDIYMNMNKEENPELTAIIEEHLRKKIESTSAPNFSLADKYSESDKSYKSYWITGGAPIGATLLIGYQILGTMGTMGTSRPGYYVLIIHLLIITLLGFAALKGRIIPGIMLLVYFLYILFRFIF